MRLNIVYSIVLLILLTINNGYTQNIFVPDSPCPQYFRYSRDSQGGYYGVLEVPPPDGELLLLKVVMTIAVIYGSGDAGSLQLDLSQDETLRRVNNNESLKYRLDFPIRNPLPKITEISYNGNSICTGPPDNARGVTTSQLSHRLSLPARQSRGQPQFFFRLGAPSQNSNSNPFNTGVNNQFGGFNFLRPFDNNGNWYGNPQYDTNSNEVANNWVDSTNNNNQQNPPQNSRPNDNNNNNFNRPSPVTPAPQQVRPQITNSVTQAPVECPTVDEAPANALRSQVTEDVCGRVDAKFTIRRLAVGGTIITRGTWPWLAAIYQTKVGEMKFQCAGNLINARTVITAGHCFYTGTKLRQPDEIMIALGRHNIANWIEDNVIMSVVSQIHVHEEFRPASRPDADIALAILATRVTYTDYIRPICLWSGQENVVNRTGYVVGWGFDGTNQLTQTPRQVSANVAEDAECLRSQDAFVRLTSNRTLCAGNRDGSGPCRGDSGSGLMIQEDGRWMIRGIVSTALTGTSICNLNEFVVYGDVEKFMDWILRTAF